MPQTCCERCLIMCLHLLCHWACTFGSVSWSSFEFPPFPSQCNLNVFRSSANRLLLHILCFGQSAIIWGCNHLHVWYIVLKFFIEHGILNLKYIYLFILYIKFCLYFRYKLDNEGYQYSPIVPIEVEPTGDNGGYQPSPAIPNEEEQISSEHDHNTKIEDIPQDYDYEIIGEKNEKIRMGVDGKLSKVCDAQESKKQGNKQGNLLKKRFHARQKSFLKTVLFEPYDELSEDEINVAKNEDTPKKMPLGVKNDIYVSGNIPSAKKFSEKRFSAGRNNSLNKLREVSICDKENKGF